MKTFVKISAVLTWINLVIGSLAILLIVLAGLGSGALLNMLPVLIIPSAIVLHSYAALQLRKSILHPEIPLSNQTPVGIRFIGYVSLFFAFMNLVSVISAFGHTKELAQQIKLPPEAADMDPVKLLHFAIVFSLLFSTSILVNVIINFRLLRWYIIETHE